MGGYGIGGFGEGFAGGFGVMEAALNRRDENKRQNERSAREQQEFDRKEAEVKQLRDLGGQLSQMTAEWLGSGQQSGVQTQPPAVDPQTGQPVAAAPAATKPMTYMDALKDSQQHLQRVAPLLMKIYTLADPKKAAEYAAGLSDAKTQYSIAEEVAVGRLLMSNPNSTEARDALTQFYGRINDGRKIVPETYEVLGNGAIKFRTTDEQGGDVKPEVIEPARVQAMMMRNLSADKLATVLVHQEQTKETKRFHDAQISNMEEDNKRQAQQYGLTAQATKEERDARREDRRLAREDRAAAVSAREKDSLVRGAAPYFMGDPKTFADRSPEEQAAAQQGMADAMSMVELNDMPKTESAGARAAATIRLIASGKVDDIRRNTNDPSTVIVYVGGQKFLLPAGSFAVNAALASRRGTPAGAAPQPRGVTRGIE